MSKKNQEWSIEAKQLINELHNEIRLSNKNWHELKNSSRRRTGELLISALSQLINGGSIEDIEEMISLSLKWLNNEIKDPGCPKH